MKVPYILSAPLAAFMVAQSVLGLVLPRQYCDAEWIRLTWSGNDRVTLVVGVSLLVVSVLLARGGSVRGLLLWLSMLGYGAYNYAYYMLGAALNAFFPLYEAPGELAQWGPLTVTTTAATALLLASVRGRWGQRT